MDLLLWRPVGPIGRHMIGRELHAEPPLAVNYHAVPVLLRGDGAAQQIGPEGALGRQVGGVEHDDLPRDFHAIPLPAARYDASTLTVGEIEGSCHRPCGAFAYPH